VFVLRLSKNVWPSAMLGLILRLDIRDWL